MAVPDELQLSLEHGRDMFKYHATQRHTSLNFYFAVLAAFVAGFVALLTSDSAWKATSVVHIGTGVIIGKLVGTALGAGAMFVTILFWLLDNRNVQLVEADKALLLRIEHELADLYSIREFETIKHSDKAKKKWKGCQSYGFLVPAVLVVFFILWTVGITMSWKYPLH